MKKDFKLFFKEYDLIEAAGGIVKRKDKFLFIKRDGVWYIPKGKKEKGESKKDSAIRGVEEESGISCPLIENKICETYHTCFYKEKPILKRTYWYSMSFTGNKDVNPQIEEGISEVLWIENEELDVLKENTYLSIIEVLDCYFV